MADGYSIYPQSFLYQPGQASARKMRLLSCAIVRRIWAILPQDHRLMIELAERYSDGAATGDELHAAHVSSSARWDRMPGISSDAARAAVNYVVAASPAVEAVARYTVEAVRHEAFRRAVAGGVGALPKGLEQAEQEEQRHLVRDVIVNPLRPVAVDRAWLAWNDGTVVKLAQAVYDEPALPSGHLDLGRLAILADALEDSGCQDAELLGHLRGPGPHARGCLVVDLLLGKE